MDDAAKNMLGKKGKYKNLELARIARQNKRKHLIDSINTKATDIVKSLEYSRNINRLLCAFLFWTEGSKDTSSLRFTNSDPRMVRTFLKLLRNGFNIEENKFRACVHVHGYHEDNEIKMRWSEVTEIPLTQFYPSYKKPNTGKRKRENYPGCISIHYHDYKIALELKHLYNAYVKLQRGVG